MPQQRLQQLFKGDAPALLLERSIAAWTSTDAALWQAVPFAGQILPDLPVASSWSGLLKSALTRYAHAVAASAVLSCICMTHDLHGSSRTVAHNQQHVWLVLVQRNSRSSSSL